MVVLFSSTFCRFAFLRLTSWISDKTLFSRQIKSFCTLFASSIRFRSNPKHIRLPMRNSKNSRDPARTQAEKEKRLAPRIEFQLDVVVRGLKGVKKVSNFSTGGVFIQNEHSSSFKRGDKIELVTRLPLEKRIMLIKAQVAHVSSKGMGVQFLDVHGPCAQAIQSNFEVFKATVPLPAP